jgi:hypothetical protein
VTKLRSARERAATSSTWSASPSRTTFSPSGRRLIAGLDLDGSHIVVYEVSLSAAAGHPAGKTASRPSAPYVTSVSGSLECPDVLH